MLQCRCVGLGVYTSSRWVPWGALGSPSSRMGHQVECFVVFFFLIHLLGYMGYPPWGGLTHAHAKTHPTVSMKNIQGPDTRAGSRPGACTPNTPAPSSAHSGKTTTSW